MAVYPYSCLGVAMVLVLLSFCFEARKRYRGCEKTLIAIYSAVKLNGTTWRSHSSPGIYSIWFGVETCLRRKTQVFSGSCLPCPAKSWESTALVGKKNAPLDQPVGPFPNGQSGMCSLRPLLKGDGLKGKAKREPSIWVPLTTPAHLLTS